MMITIHIRCQSVIRRETKRKKTVHYSVNRYGSVYVLGDYEKKLNGSYVDQASNIKITEINPSKLKTHDLQLIKDNEKS